MSFSNKKILDAHIALERQKENSKHTIEREQSLSNHKQKKYNLWILDTTNKTNNEKRKWNKTKENNLQFSN